VRRALDLVAVQRHPSEDEKQSAHDRISELAQSDLPKWFAFEPSNPELGYSVYAQKFLPETWELLKNSNMAKPYSVMDFQDYVLNKWFGLTMMSILAETCAGATKRLVTDESDSYSALGRYITAFANGSYGSASPDHESLVTLPIGSFDLTDTSLQQLNELRSREDSFLRQLRHNYLTEVDQAASELAKARGESDRKEVERLFHQKLSDDMRELAKALRRTATSSLLSKEVLVAVLAVAGAVVEPWTSSIVGVGALSKGLTGYRSKREDIMRKHASAWLYNVPARFRVV